MPDKFTFLVQSAGQLESHSAPGIAFGVAGHEYIPQAYLKLQEQLAEGPHWQLIQKLQKAMAIGLQD